MSVKTICCIVILSLLLACAKQQAESQTAASSSPADVTVTIKDFKFVPEVVTVKQDQTVKLVNEDGAVHTVEANNKAFSSPTLSRGSEWTFTFDKKGAYEYVCGVHPTMKGKIVVE